MSDGVTRPAPDGRWSSTRLDKYVDRYAARTHGMTASEIRALFSVASRPEVVSLAGGMPNISGLPLDVVGGAIADLVARPRARTAMQYGSGQGDPVLREQICEVMRARGHRGAPRRRRGHRRLAAGARPGHPDLLRPRRRGALRGARPTSARSASSGPTSATSSTSRWTPTDWSRRRSGQAIASAQGGGADDQVRLHDPELPQPGRRDLSRGASAGDPRDLPRGRRARPRGQPVRPARLRRRPATRRCGPTRRTASSTSARSPRPSRPGFRVGWALAPHAVREKLVLAQESATLCPPSFSQMAISAYLRSPRLAGPDQARSGRCTASAATP